MPNAGNQSNDFRELQLSEQENYSVVTVKITETQKIALQRMGVEVISGPLGDLIEAVKGQTRVMREIAVSIDLCVQMMAQDRDVESSDGDLPSFLNQR